MIRNLVAAGVAALLVGLPTMALAGGKGDAHVDTNVANPPVSYPEGAQRSGEQGTVRMLVKVSDLGHPIQVRVVKSSGYSDLDDAASGGVLRWHYIPASYGSDWADVQVEYKVPAMAPAAAAASVHP